MSRRERWVLLFALCTLARAVAAPSPTLEVNGRPFRAYDYVGVGTLEQQANVARDYYWTGRYHEALEILDRLCAEAHNSTALYLRERAMLHLAMGNDSLARQDLLDGATFSENIRVADLEKEALKLSGREVVKIYSGDPYESASNYLLLALLLLKTGDIDNALAACKSGILADSDASEGRYTSDFTLLHLLEAKCLQLRGDYEGAMAVYAVAATSHRTTHPTVRALFTKRLDLLELLKLTPKQRKKLGKTEDEKALNTELAGVDNELAAAAAAVSPEKELGALLTGNYNALMLLPTSRVHHKIRQGQAGNLVVFEGVDAGDPVGQLTLDGAHLPPDWIRHVADFSFQAETRGGRRMDGILAGEAAFRATTVGIGNFLLGLGDGDGVFGLLGTIVAGAGASVNAEADTRCWQTLPARFQILALTLPPGQHALASRSRLYFEAMPVNNMPLSVVQGQLAVGILPGLPTGRFSENAITTSQARKRRFPAPGVTGDRIFALAPPLGIPKIERIPVPGIERPLAFSADPNRLMQQIERDIDALGVDAFQVVHAEIMQDPISAARLATCALQTEVLNVQVETGKLTVRCRFAVVVCENGTVLAAGEYTGNASIVNPAKVDGNALFYEAFGAAWRQALSANLLRTASSTASKVASAAR